MTIISKCSCDGPWPCAKRRWWNRWRHQAIVDVQAMMADELASARRQAKLMALINGDEKFKNWLDEMYQKFLDDQKPQ